jgi:5-methylcytosine-specific restriction endonuclease McrA
MRDRTRSAPPVSRSDATTLGRALDRATNEVPERTRAAVFLRDNGRCRRCGRRSGLALHHINYRSEGVDHQAHNLVVLCDVCHDWVHADKTARKPLLLAYVWLLYVERRQVYIRQLERA